MKKLISVFLSTAIFISCVAFPTYAANTPNGIVISTRETNIDKYDNDTLMEKVLDGSISEDEFTKIDIQHAEDADGKVTTITIKELKERRIEQGKTVESYVQQTSSTKSAGNREGSDTYASGVNSFTLTFKLLYDRIPYQDGALYKITQMQGSYSNVAGRLVFPKLFLYCSSGFDAYASSNVRYGYNRESAQSTFTALSSNTVFTKNTGFQYYYYDFPTGSVIGGNATLDYKIGNNTTTHSFTVNISIT
ncbi:MAG: hypothetical protein ACI3XD_01085 [Oscillospiraceae bacterium]